ncbi:MAG: carbohydrate ABC transporter substrate-binding protein [Proteobacteria bacterium]|nr:carbohydrate ABC transporter substrate-binding protein [Pseudomonadota bacterium]
MGSIDRRSLLKAGTGAFALTLAGLSPALAEDKRLRMYWWGGKERADRTFKVNDLYSAANAGVKIDGETLGWGDYWARLATQAAGRNAPDVIQMDYRYIFEYARRGALLPLDEYVPKLLSIEDFGKVAIDSGRVDGKIYGVSLGLNSTALLYNKSAFEKAGLPPPTHETTWAEFANLTAELTKANVKPGFWGSMDGGGNEPALEVWVRQRGKQLYNQEGKLGFDEKDAADWFAFWDDMRKRKACVPPDVQALDRNAVETAMLSQGRGGTGFEHSNLLVAYQTLNKDKLSMTMYPQGGTGAMPGQYLKPSQMWSVYARSKLPEEAVKIVNFFVEDKEAAKVLKVERGVPASARIREQIAPDLDELDRESVKYVALVSERVGPLPLPPPNGAGEIAQTLKRVNEEVGFGRLAPAAAGKQFTTEASSILARG